MAENENYIFMKQWQALVIPLSLTSLMYSGSFILKILQLLDSYKEHQSYGGNEFVDYVIAVPQRFSEWIFSMASNISAWRNYIVVSICINLLFSPNLAIFLFYVFMPSLFSGLSYFDG